MCAAAIDGHRRVPDAWYDAPTFYFTNPHAVLGPDDEVRSPALAQRETSSSRSRSWSAGPAAP